ncbi:hypothetical protein BSNK01_31470 [Bacillaceae bacterium]
MHWEGTYGKIAGIPYIYRAAEGPRRERAPHVILLHQFTLSKERMRPLSLKLAAQGIATLAVDLPYHGEREEGYFTLPKEEQWRRQGEILIQGVKDVATLYREWQRIGGSDPQTPWGVIGFSLGALVAYGSLARYRWLQAGVAYIGTPAWETFLRNMHRLQRVTDVSEDVYEEIREWDPIRRWKELAAKDLLMINAERDVIVPPRGSRDLMEILRQHGMEERVELVEVKDVGHRVTDEMMDRGVQWIKERLNVKMIMSWP